MKKVIVLLIICFCLTQMGKSQNQCPLNNRIQLKPSICTDYIALLEGSTPSGGSETYSYIWQKNEEDCGEKGFVDIPGATGINYGVPKSNNSEGKVCYRRIVISGNCREESEKVMVQRKETPDIIALKVSVTVQPTCASITGTIEVNEPTGSGFEYSLDGGPYQTTTIFTNIPVGLHFVTFRNKADPTCISRPITVTLNEPPKPSGTITPSQAAICPGGSTTLTVSGGTSYQWYRDGTLIQGATNAAYQATQPGSYSVTLINGSCQAPASNQAAVTVAALPTGTITPATATLCPGGSQLLTATGGASYQWYRDGVALQGATAATYTATQSGSYSVDIVSAAGCSTKASNNTAVTVGAPLTITATPQDLSCRTPSGSITIAATGGSQPPYSYSKDNGATFQPEPLFKDLSPGTYQVVVRDAAGCSSAVVPVTIKQTSTALSATVATMDIGCTQTSGAAAVTASGGTAPYSYSVDGGSFAATATFSNLSAGPHKVVVRDAAGCSRELSFTIKASGTTPQMVVRNPLPLCTGSLANLTAATLTTGSDTGLTYSYWRDSTATVAVNNPAAVGAGTYYIKATNRGGCSTLKAVVVTATNTPAGRITPERPTTSCTGSPVTLSASSGSSYQWYRNDSLIQGATAATYQANQSGSYAVLIGSGSSSCRAANVVVVRFEACIPVPGTKVFVPTAFTPNGNGANDRLQPYFTGVRELVYFKVFNRWGQQVFQTNTIGEGWDGRLKGALQPPETYSWTLKCIDAAGNHIQQSGRSLLIR